MSLQARLQELFADQPDKKPAHLAKTIGRSRTTVGQWLNGRSKTIYDEGVAQKVADFFGCQYDWIVRGIGEKYAKDNNGLSNKADNLGEQELKKNLNPALVKNRDTSMLTSTLEKNLSREEKMNLDLVRRMHNIEDGNIIHGLSLLLTLENAKDRDKQVIEALNAISLSVVKKNVDIVVSDTGNQDMPVASSHHFVKN